MGKITLRIFIIISVFAISCNSSQNNDIHVTGKPGILFEKKVHDFGKIEYNGNGLYDFTFKNNGDQPLMINNVRTSCGCTVSKYSKEPYMPDSIGSVKVNYDTRRVGSFEKTITVYTNAEEKPVLLRIKGVIKKPDEEATR